jgi:hypothetical protein
MATLGTFTAGQVLTASELNNAMPLCILENGSFALPAGAGTSVTFGTEVLDPLNWHSTVTNTSRVTPTIAGYYFVTLQLNDVTGAGQTRALMRCNKNGTDISPVRIQMDTNGTDDDFSLSGYISLNGTTDYVEMNILQTNTSSASRTITARFTVQFVRPL